MTMYKGKVRVVEVKLKFEGLREHVSERKININEGGGGGRG